MSAFLIFCPCDQAVFEVILCADYSVEKFLYYFLLISMKQKKID